VEPIFHQMFRPDLQMSAQTPIILEEKQFETVEIDFKTSNLGIFSPVFESRQQ